MNNEIKNHIQLIETRINSSNGTEPVLCNPFVLKEIIKYIKYLENQVELNKFEPEDEERMNVLFIKGRYGDIVKSLSKTDGYDFGNNRKWNCKLFKAIQKIDEMEGTLYEIIDMLEFLKEKGSKKK